MEARMANHHELAISPVMLGLRAHAGRFSVAEGSVLIVWSQTALQ